MSSKNWLATNAIRPLIGVTGVSDQIVIKPSNALGAIKSVIEAALGRRGETQASKIAVDVQGSEVTLSGTVRSWIEREAAWGTPGVRSVVDNIAVVF